MKIRLLIKKHFKNIGRNKRVILFVLVILFANHIGSKIVKFFLDFTIHFTPQYLFNGIWNDMPEIMRRIWIYVVTVVPAIDFGIALIGLACFRRIAEQFVNDYWSKMKYFSSSTSKSVVWFYIQKTYIHIGYIIWIVVAYLFSFWLYKNFHFNSLWIFFLLVIIGYPVFYFAQSVVALLATLPLKNCERSAKLTYLYSTRAFKILYPFYSVRIGLEFLLAFVLPLLLSYLNVLEFLIPWLVAVGLCVPFSFLRTLSFEVKLEIFKGDKKIDSLLSIGC